MRWVICSVMARALPLILRPKNTDGEELKLMPFIMMVVDEEAPVLSLAQAVLEPLGCEVLAQSDSREAETVAQTRKLHGVLLAARMRHPDGFELTHAIRRSRLNSRVPIVMLTAEDDAKTMRRGIQEGINFFLAKPLSEERLVHLFQAMRRAMWEERRRHARLPLRVTATCSSPCGTLKLQTRNISRGGLLLEPSEGLVRCQEIELEFALPGYDRPIRVHATVQHQSPEAGIGVKFQDVSEVDRRAINGYVSGALEKRGRPLTR